MGIQQNIAEVKGVNITAFMFTWDLMKLNDYAVMNIYMGDLFGEVSGVCVSLDITKKKSKHSFNFQMFTVSRKFFGILLFLSNKIFVFLALCFECRKIA